MNVNNFYEQHRDKLGHYVMVFGLVGLAFYAIMVLASFLLKYGAQLPLLLKGFGL